jgi:hypothetical protein
MSKVDSKPKLVGKLFHRSYLSLGENLLEKWSAAETSPGNYLVNRPNGTTLEVAIGGEVPNIGLVAIDSNQNITIGKYTIIAGENVLFDWSAKPIRGQDNYRIRTAEGKFLDVKLGGTIEDLDGQITLSEKYDKIMVGNRTIPLYRKQYEQNLIIFDVKERSGQRAFFNLLEPGNENNRKDGIQGIFYPAPSGNKPARFCEVGPDGKIYATAVFWPSKNKQFTNGKLRDINLAIEEKSIVNEINKINLKIAEVEAEAVDIGFGIEDHPEYEDYTIMQSGLDKLQERLTYLNKDAWENKSFSVTSGHEMLGLVSTKKTPSYTS